LTSKTLRHGGDSPTCKPVKLPGKTHSDQEEIFRAPASAVPSARQQSDGRGGSRTPLAILRAPSIPLTSPCSVGEREKTRILGYAGFSPQTIGGLASPIWERDTKKEHKRRTPSLRNLSSRLRVRSSVLNKKGRFHWFKIFSLMVGSIDKNGVKQR
jgi:hypothetical protein